MEPLTVPSESRTTSQTPVRVLIVDDESSLLMTLAANLELEGFDVVEASTPQRALELVRSQHFDLVLSDIRMPGMTGVDLFHAIRATHPAMPVILMTAFALEAMVRDAIEHGVYTVLAKPFEIEHVAATVLRAGRGPAVLVVDDSAPLAESTAAALRSAGVRARAEFAGDTAVEAVRSGGVDVCVVDLVMPDVDGAEAIRRIREIDGTISCIAVTGHDSQDLLRKVASSGAVACMRKPVAVEELIRTIALARGARPRVRR